MWCVSHRLLLNNISLRMSSNPSLKFKASSAFPLNSVKLFSKRSRMETGEGAKSAKNPKDDRIEELIQRDPKGGWDKCWEQGLTPWDLKQPTPVLLHLHQTDALPKGRALVPGCGTGYDVVAIASPDRYVVGLEISEHAIEKAEEEDFFTWHPTDLFDLIYDYTFFCAIEPSMRSAWAQRIQDCLKPDGELLTLMFPISDHVGGPPFKVSVTDYEEVLRPMGFRAVSIVDNDLAVGPRKGREKLGRWKRSPNLSLL